MYAVTGATGQLGRLTIDALLRTVPADRIVAVVRTPAKAADLAARGVIVREGDYDRPETLTSAFAGVERLLLISSSEVGRRTAQHRSAIDAAAAAGVSLIAYTSVLHADDSTLGLAPEHRATEALLRDGTVPFVLLRNGWYHENYLAGLAPAIEHGALLGSARDGRIASASRADYADAAAAALTAAEPAGKVYELAGDHAYTLTELAATIAAAAGKPVVYRDLPEADYAAILEGAGLPAPVASMIAESDAKAADGALFDDGGQLSALIGRPTTPIATSVREAVARLG